MIVLSKSEDNKLVIMKNGNMECKPWGMNTGGENSEVVKISSLLDRESTYEAHFSGFAIVSGGVLTPFDNLQSLLEYITPCLGFNPASGGSEATVFESSILYTAPNITTMGTSPIDLSEHFPVLPTEGQFYNILELITILTPGTVAYSGSERIAFFGAFYFVSDEFTLNAPPGSEKRITVSRNTREFIFNDGVAVYSNHVPSFTADQGLYLSTLSGEDVSAGNGTLEVRVKYTIENL